MSHLASRVIAILALLVFTLGAAAPASAASDEVGAVYTLTNAASGNAVIAYARSSSGELSWSGTYPTGGQGTGAGLGSQGAVVTSDNGKWLYAVDAASNDVATFAIEHDGLALIGRTPSGGTMPISITTNGDTVYVLNAGTRTIAGFSAKKGILEMIPGAVRSLLGSGPAQVQFSPSGDALVVTNKATSTLDTFTVDQNGVAGLARSFASSGSTPFGFAFGHRDQLVVSEAAGAPAGLSAASSYQLNADGSLTAVTRSAPTTQAAACWVAITKDGRYAFTANAASDSISTFAIGDDGTLALVHAQAAHGAAAHTTDMATSRNSRFLYALDGGTHMVSAFRIGADGSLTRLDGITVPTTAAGIAAH
jgi:6-phosphogluconolactonase